MKQIKIDIIKENPNNPRVIKDAKFKQLVQSIKDFPEMLKLRPLIIDENNIVLGGNMRLKACKEIGLKEVPVLQASDLTEDQKKQFIIKDNVGFGEWDWDVIANEWDIPLITEWGLDIPSFEPPVEPVGNFADEGIGQKSQYGVIVMCDGEAEQETIFNRLTGEGLKCKIVVT